MILSWIFGILLIHTQGFESLGFLWMKLKLGLVLILTGYHFYLLIILKISRLIITKNPQNTLGSSTEVHNIVNYHYICCSI